MHAGWGRSWTYFMRDGWATGIPPPGVGCFSSALTCGSPQVQDQSKNRIGAHGLFAGTQNATTSSPTRNWSKNWAAAFCPKWMHPCEGSSSRPSWKAMPPVVK